MSGRARLRLVPGFELIRRVFSRLLGPAAPKPRSEQQHADRVWVTATVLADDLGEYPALGFVFDTAEDRMRTALVWVWLRWLVETGRDPEQVADVDARQEVAG